MGRELEQLSQWRIILKDSLVGSAILSFEDMQEYVKQQHRGGYRKIVYLREGILLFARV